MANKKRNAASKKQSGHKFVTSAPKLKLSKWDFIIMAVIVIIYGLIALYNLGDKFAPQTEVELSSEEITADLGEMKNISKTSIYLGARHLDDSRAIDIKFYDDNNREVSSSRVSSGSVFCWNVTNTNVNARYVSFSTQNVRSQTDPTDNIYVKEICLIDSDGNKIEPVNADDKSIAHLFDEQDCYSATKNFMTGTYFDEIYHGRTAYEFINHMTVYEWTHPPLGKVLIGFGILAYGMVPFGWRIVGTLFGIFMVPLIYLFAKRMLKHTWLAAVICLLFTFDFMHFTQSRISTIDVYVTFFIMLMYYFMYKYYKMSFYDTPLWKTLVPLGLSGIFFGFSVASKWTGLYGGAGLALIFFYTVYERCREYSYAAKNPNGETSGISHKYVIKNFEKYLFITLGFCVIMFIVVPMCIYALSYIPYLKTPSGHGLVATIRDNAKSMYTYHSKTVAASTHPYSSHWFEWPIMYRPLWYFSNTTADGLRQGISAFGNPAVWWLGIGALGYITALAIIIPLKKRKYYFMNKYIFAGIYALVFVLICTIGYTAGKADPEKLVRLFPCLVFYSSVMVGMFLIVLLFDEYIKQTSNKTALFILIGYFSGLLPWTLVVRTTYIYHYFPCVPFVVLMLGYSIKTFYDNTRSKKAVIIASAIYAAAAIGLFIMFYPVLCGHPITKEYGVEWLKWFRSWVLIP
ncbi:MAG: phospholipid carrier-dependent glycosyltransferase [Oscillospiraceae bacterium]|nr:phospholipid carrier-dependent glycosyltransferase [Oscillospiraceae bacterium]